MQEKAVCSTVVCASAGVALGEMLHKALRSPGVGQH